MDEPDPLDEGRATANKSVSPLAGQAPGEAGPESPPEPSAASATRTTAPATPPATTPIAKSTGRWLAGYSLLFALAAVGLAGYLYYVLVFLTPMAPLDTRIVGVENRTQQIAGDLDALESQQATALAAFAETQRTSLDLAQERMVRAFNNVAEQAPPSRREWMVAEVAYLLRIANHRLLMERDVDSALHLLTAADTILLELDDFGLYQVRAELADEILALKNVESNDVQGIYLRIEAVKGDLVELPLQLPEYLLDTGATGQSAQEVSLWEALVDQFSGYLRFRRFDGSTKPLLAPEEARYLELNLRLMLERAQLAALRREQTVYAGSLTSAAQWLGAYLDTTDESIARSMAELTALAAIDLNQELPDISTALISLQSIQREDL